MCIIIVKNKGVLSPYKSTLKKCFENNNDGAGYAYAKNGAVYIKKGFMTFNDFYRNYIKDIKTSTAAVIHFRITTQGGIKKSLTHPYPLSANLSDLTQLVNCCSLAIAHNGVIELTSSARKDRNDTMDFIAEYLTLILTNNGDNLKENHIRRLIEKLGGSSRFAFLKNDGTIEMLGAGWVEDYNGLYFSNRTYKKSYYDYCFKSWEDYEDFYAQLKGDNEYYDL